MRRILLIAVCAVSLTGWGLYFHALSGSSRTEERVSEQVFARLEEQRKVEDSLKQDVETQKRNALLLREQEFEREVESSALQYQEEMKKGLQDWYADMQGDAAKRQAEQTARDEAFRKQTGDALNEFFASVRQELGKRAEEEAKKLEAAQTGFQSRLQEIMIVREKERAALTEEREKDRREIAGLRARLAELESFAGKLSAQVKELQKPVPAQRQGG